VPLEKFRDEVDRTKNAVATGNTVRAAIAMRSAIIQSSSPQDREKPNRPQARCPSHARVDRTCRLPIAGLTRPRSLAFRLRDSHDRHNFYIEGNGHDRPHSHARRQCARRLEQCTRVPVVDHLRDSRIFYRRNRRDTNVSSLDAVRSGVRREKLAQIDERDFVIEIPKKLHGKSSRSCLRTCSIDASGQRSDLTSNSGFPLVTITYRLSTTPTK
jgi:hypothetical protein